MNAFALKPLDDGCSRVEDRSPQPTNLRFRRRMVQHHRRIGSKKEPIQASEFAWKAGITPDSAGWHITLSALEKRYFKLHAGDGLSKEVRYLNYVILIFRVNITNETEAVSKSWMELP